MDAPDFNEFGPNLYRAKLIQRDSLVTISHRGWLSALAFFFFLGVIPAVIIIKERTAFSGIGLLLYFLPAAGTAIAILYGTYRQDLLLDFSTGRYRLTHGFIGFLKERSGPFADISSVTIREIRQSGGSSWNIDSDSQKYVSWGIGIECTSGIPVFEIWQTPEKKVAESMGDTLAKAFNCKVRNASE